MKYIIYLLFVLQTSQHIYAQTKRGYIDFEQTFLHIPENIKQNHPEYINKSQRLDDLQKLAKDSLSILHENYNKFMNALIIDSPCFPSIDSIKAWENRIIQSENQIEKFYLSKQSEIESCKKTLDRCLLKITLKELKAFFKTENIGFIADKKSVYYCPDCIDYTNAFIEYLKHD